MYGYEYISRQTAFYYILTASEHRLATTNTTERCWYAFTLGESKTQGRPVSNDNNIMLLNYIIIIVMIIILHRLWDYSMDWTRKKKKKKQLKHPA